MLLSKSDYMLFLRHPAWLWLKKNDPSKLIPITTSVQQRMNTGYEFEKHAEQLFKFVTGVHPLLDRSSDGY